MLSNKIQFLDHYCLETSRRFAVKNTNDHTSFALIWKRHNHTSYWYLYRSSQLITKCASKNLTYMLKKHDICPENFENQLTQYLFNYGAFMLDAIQDLSQIIHGASLYATRESFASFGNQLFDLIEKAITASTNTRPLPRTLHKTNKGYDLSNLNIASALKPAKELQTP